MSTTDEQVYDLIEQGLAEAITAEAITARDAFDIRARVAADVGSGTNVGTAAVNEALVLRNNVNDAAIVEAIDGFISQVQQINAPVAPVVTAIPASVFNCPNCATELSVAIQG